MYARLISISVSDKVVPWHLKKASQLACDTVPLFGFLASEGAPLAEAATEDEYP